MLLILVVFGVGIIRSYFTPERTRRILAGKRESVRKCACRPARYCNAVLFMFGGAAFYRLSHRSVPLGVTFSFLISAPMVNEIALVLLYGLFGWKIAAIYLSTGLIIAMVAGWTIGRLKMENHLEEWVYQIQVGESGATTRSSMSLADRSIMASKPCAISSARCGSTLS